MQRRQQLAVDDEEELLRMQEHFAASAAQGDSRPAAKVTRVSRRPAAAAATQPAAQAAPPPAPSSQQPCAEHGPGCTGQHQNGQAASVPQQQQAQGLLAAMQAALHHIVGNVQEREPTAAEPPRPPTAPTPASATPGAFPEATHRKLSKFALGRQRQRAAGAAAVSAPAAVPAPPQEVPAAGLSDEAHIDAENRQLLAAMTPEQLAEAREEVLQRLPPAAADFLRRRGEAKAAAAAATPTSASPVAAASGAVAPSQQPGSTGRAPASRLQRPQQQQLQQQAAPSSGAPLASVAARLRFDLGGRVVGLRPAGSTEDVAPADVAERDILRQARQEDGGAAAGYSVQEACLLARSSLPQQRVLALRLLGAVLAQSQPSVGGAAPATVLLPPAVMAALQQEGSAAAAGLEWTAVRHHALHAADVTLLLRRSLDDANTTVAAAAAEALAALVGAAGPGAAAEEAAAEAADACPLTGWPAPPMRHMQRPTASGAWVAAPPSARAHEERDGEDDGGEEGEGPLDEKQLAKVDPLTGLLHMALLPRCAYLLGTARAAGAVDPLLSILIRRVGCCQAGKDVADQVIDTPGLLSALQAVLNAPPPAAGAEGATDMATAAFYAARPKAMRLLRQLAAASRAAARQLLECGLVRFALDQLLRPAGLAVEPAPAAGARLRQRGQLCEALRLWRCFAQHGFFLLLLDDAFESLCASLAPPPPPMAGAGTAGSGGDAAVLPEALQQWAVAREAYSAAAALCWHAARSEQHESQLSPQCAAALASSTLAWLVGLPLQQLLEAAADGSVDGSSGQLSLPSEAALSARLSSYPALTSAAASAGITCQQAVVQSTLAAALHLVGSYWATQTWHTAAEKAAAAAQLATAGLLPAADGSAASLPAVLQAVCGALERLVGSDATWRAPDAGTAAAAVACAELAVTLARLAATFLPPARAAATSASLLQPLYSQQAASRFQRLAVAADATLLQPWDAARQQQWLPLARAALAGLQAAARSGSGSDSGGGGSEGAHLPAAAADTALALLLLLPPGEEPGALQLLALVLGPQQLAGTFAAASAALQGAGDQAAQLAAEGPATPAAAGAACGPPAMPDARQLSAVLLAGYAAPWLGLVPEQQDLEGETPGAAAGPEPPQRAALLRPQGSRLPLPPDWMLAELPLPPAEAGVAAGPSHAASGALALALGCEQQQLSATSAAAAADHAALAEHKLRSALLLLFGEQPAPSGVVPGGPLGAIAEDEDEAVWQHPVARWCLAALMQRYATAAVAVTGGDSSGGGGTGAAADPSSSGLRSWQQQEARQLAQRFAAASYGDRLWGAGVATLLRQAVSLDVQLEVLHVLADEQALHLLPPLRLLPGPPAAYLNVPAAAAAAFGRACFGGAPGSDGGGGGGGSRRQELDQYVKLLGSGPLERCMEAAGGSDGDDSSAAGGEGDGSSLAACSAAVPIVLHRLALACLPDAAPCSEIGAQQEQRRQQATLCAVLQRCAGAGASPGQRRLLGMLLRWDASAGQPSDAVSEARLRAIETACAATGLETAAVLGAALEA